MCLYIKKNRRVKIAKEDIVCYKRLIGYCVLVTYFQGAPVVIGETYESDLIVDDGNTIDIGLHSFDSIENACLCFEHVVVAECIIPKGSRYYIGEFANKTSYASNKLTYVKLLPCQD